MMSSDSCVNCCRCVTRSALSRSTMSRVLGAPPLGFVETPRLQLLDVVEAGDRGGHLVAEIRVLLEHDRALRDAGDARGGVRDPQLLGPVVAVLAADPSGIQEVGLDRVRGQQLQQAVALQTVGQREERVRSRHTQELAFLGGTSRGGARGLTEHEERRRLLLGQLGDGGDDVLVAVQDQQIVDRPDVARILVGQQVPHLEDRAPVLRVVLVEEVDRAVLVLGRRSRGRRCS